MKSSNQQHIQAIKPTKTKPNTATQQSNINNQRSQQNKKQTNHPKQTIKTNNSSNKQ